MYLLFVSSRNSCFICLLCSYLAFIFRYDELVVYLVCEAKKAETLLDSRLSISIDAILTNIPYHLVTG